VQTAHHIPRERPRRPCRLCRPLRALVWGSVYLFSGCSGLIITRTLYLGQNIVRIPIVVPLCDPLIQVHSKQKKTSTCICTIPPHINSHTNPLINPRINRRVSPSIDASSWGQSMYKGGSASEPQFSHPRWIFSSA